MPNTSKKNKPPFLPKLDVIGPGEVRSTNQQVVQVNDASATNGFRDKTIMKPSKTPFGFLVRFPRYCARGRNLWHALEYEEKDREEILKLRAAEAMRLDKKDFDARVKWLLDNDVDLDELNLEKIVLKTD